jgi:hypothetical protein
VTRLVREGGGGGGVNSSLYLATDVRGTSADLKRSSFEDGIRIRSKSPSC